MSGAVTVVQVGIPGPPGGTGPAGPPGFFTYIGVWDATANSPTLTSSVAPSTPAGATSPNGCYYIVSNPGTTNLDGNGSWQIEDWVVWNSALSKWQSVPVSSSTMLGVVMAQRYGAFGNGTTDDTTALQNLLTYCAANGRIAYLPAVGYNYLISGPLVANFTRGGGIVMETKGYGTANDNSIQVTGSGYVALTVTGNPSVLDISMFGNANSADGIQLGTGTGAGVLSQVKSGHIRVYKLGGFGVNINTAYDCLFDTISVELCGTTSKYAFQMDSVGDTTNEVHILRLQVEQAQQLAINMGPHCMTCKVDSLHSERANTSTPVMLTPTWTFQWYRSEVSRARFEGNNKGYCYLGGSNNNYYGIIGDTNCAILVGDTGQPNCYYGLAGGNPFVYAGNSLLTFYGGSVNTFTYQLKGGVTLRDMSITTLSIGYSNNLTANGLLLDDCSVANIESTDGTSAATFVNCPSLALLTTSSPAGSFPNNTRLINSIITLPSSYSLGSKALECHASTIICAALNVNSAYLGLYNRSIVQGALAVTPSSNSQVYFDDSSFATGGVTSYFPPVSGVTYSRPVIGELVKNPAPAVGQPISWLAIASQPAWIANNNYAAGATCVGGNYSWTASAGTSGATVPAWPSTASATGGSGGGPTTVTDNGVTWTYLGWYSKWESTGNLT